MLSVKAGSEFEEEIKYGNNGSEMLRENVIRQIVSFTDEDIIVSTTGKTSVNYLKSVVNKHHINMIF